jgi:F-type H+-transporting ATPase subunit alpha
MEAFAQFASDLDASTQRLLARGARLTEILKQGQFQPLSVGEQVASIYAGVRGYADTIPVGDIVRFEGQMLSSLRESGKDILDTINSTGELNDDTDKKLGEFLGNFVKNFA